jgi:hypothetical protein
MYEDKDNNKEIDKEYNYILHVKEKIEKDLFNKRMTGV